MGGFNIHEITAYIRDNISSELTVEQAAKHFNCSLSHFSREFKKAARFSAAEFISALKVEHSIKVLGNNATVLKAQLEGGFLSSGTFSNLFNRCTGLSPKQYQKKMSTLFDELKKHEQKEEAGAISYPPPPQTYPLKNPRQIHVLCT
jgi:AraC-like DNA-binding protein